MDSPKEVPSIQATRRNMKKGKHHYSNSMNDTYATWRIFQKESKKSKSTYKNKQLNSKNDSVQLNQSIRAKSRSLPREDYKGLTLEEYFRIKSNIQSKTEQMIKRNEPSAEDQLNKEPFNIRQVSEENEKEVVTPQFNNNQNENQIAVNNQIVISNGFQEKYHKRMLKMKSEAAEEIAPHKKQRSRTRFPTMCNENTDITLRRFDKHDLAKSKYQKKAISNSILNIQFRDDRTLEVIKKNSRLIKVPAIHNRLSDLTVGQIALHNKYNKLVSKLHYTNSVKYHFNL